MSHDQKKKLIKKIISKNLHSNKSNKDLLENEVGNFRFSQKADGQVVEGSESYSKESKEAMEKPADMYFLKELVTRCKGDAGKPLKCEDETMALNNAGTMTFFKTTDKDTLHPGV